MTGNTTLASFIKTLIIDHELLQERFKTLETKVKDLEETNAFQDLEIAEAFGRQVDARNNEKRLQADIADQDEEIFDLKKENKSLRKEVGMHKKKKVKKLKK